MEAEEDNKTLKFNSGIKQERKREQETEKMKRNWMETDILKDNEVCDFTVKKTRSLTTRMKL